MCEPGHSYYQQGLWESEADSLLREVGAEQFGGSCACRSPKTLGCTPQTAEPTGPEGKEAKKTSLCKDVNKKIAASCTEKKKN